MSDHTFIQLPLKMKMKPLAKITFGGKKGNLTFDNLTKNGPLILSGPTTRRLALQYSLGVSVEPCLSRAEWKLTWRPEGGGVIVAQLQHERPRHLTLALHFPGEPHQKN